jgi:hypothetical protein
MEGVSEWVPAWFGWLSAALQRVLFFFSFSLVFLCCVD